ncbi:MAG: hypothetical protein ACI9S8_001313 [Chlamydiales bacterium]|jgi:hypothetical protein
MSTLCNENGLGYRSNPITIQKAPESGRIARIRGSISSIVKRAFSQLAKFFRFIASHLPNPLAKRKVSQMKATVAKVTPAPSNVIVAKDGSLYDEAPAAPKEPAPEVVPFSGDAPVSPEFVLSSTESKEAPVSSESAPSVTIVKKARKGVGGTVNSFGMRNIFRHFILATALASVGDQKAYAFQRFYITDMNNQFNLGDSKGITKLHRLAKDGNVYEFQRVASALRDRDLKLSEGGNFGEAELDDCMDWTGAQKLNDLDVSKVKTTPPTIVQNFCNTQVRMVDGSILTIEATNAAEVFEKVMGEKPNGVLTTFASPGHGFMNIDCEGCSDKPRVQETMGFYPAGGLRNGGESLPGRVTISSVDFIRDETTSGANNRENLVMLFPQRGHHEPEHAYKNKASRDNDLQLLFQLTDEQSKSVVAQIGKVKAGCRALDQKKCDSTGFRLRGRCEQGRTKEGEACTYNLFSRNCVDFVEETFEATGSKGHFMDFLTETQMERSIKRDPQHLMDNKALNFGYIRSRGILPWLKKLFTSSS